MTGYLAVASIHVIAATIWVGGTLFLALVGAPALRHVEPAALRTSLFNSIGRRFRYVGWGAVAALLVTGVMLVAIRGWFADGLLFRRDFWRTAAGMALGWKLALVTMMLVSTALHDLAFDPRRASLLSSSPKVRRGALLLGRLGALVATAVVVAAVRLART